MEIGRESCKANKKRDDRDREGEGETEKYGLKCGVRT